MNFGEAIEAMKNDHAVVRSGWNGRGMFIYLDRFDNYGYEPFICMYTAQGKFQPGWLASQMDMLADDWEIVNLDCLSSSEKIREIRELHKNSQQQQS